MKYLAGDICQIDPHNFTGYGSRVALRIVELLHPAYPKDDITSPHFIWECWLIGGGKHIRVPDQIGVYNKDLIPILLVPR